MDSTTIQLIAKCMDWAKHRQQKIAYVDFEHLYHLHQRSIIWVTRSKENMCFEIMGQQLSKEEIQQAQHMLESKTFVGQQPPVFE